MLLYEVDNMNNNHPAGEPAENGVNSSSSPSKERDWFWLIIASAVGAVVTYIIGSIYALIMHLPRGISVPCAIVVAGAIALGLYLRKHVGILPRTLAVLLVIGAFGLGVVVGRVTVRPPVSLALTAPRSAVDCTSSPPQCQFQVTGRVTPKPTSDLQIVILIYPTDPSGHGWYTQFPPANIEASGDWSQATSYIGASTAPARNGDSFNIEAILVHAGATYGSSTLEDISKSGMPITDVSQITGLVAESQIVPLTVIRR
jgi:hypothetical protein